MEFIGSDDSLKYDDLVPVVIEMERSLLANSSLIFKNVATKSHIEELITKSLDLSIRQKKIENTTFYIELSKKQ